MDFAVMKEYLPRFWDALLLTLKIGWQGVALSLALGIACAVVVHLKIPVLRRLVGIYIDIARHLLSCHAAAGVDLRKLRCLNGLEPIQGGEILLDGERVLRDDASITKMRQKIGMVFQSYELFPHKTILENILLAPTKVQKRPRAQVEAEALELLQKVGLESRKDDYPRQLSGGQKQRVAIVRAL